jgi:hypothetical protein
LVVIQCSQIVDDQDGNHPILISSLHKQWLSEVEIALVIIKTSQVVDGSEGIRM